MTTTPRLVVTELNANDSQPEVVVNSALRVYDALIQTGIEDRDLTAPPGSPVDGALYIVGAGATGVWAGRDGAIAQYYDAAWRFFNPAEGWRVYVRDEDLWVVLDSGAWVSRWSAEQIRAGNVNTETLAADKTLTTTDPQVHFLDPGGANRNVDLPAEAASTGLAFELYNTADAAEDLVVRDDSGVQTIVTISQNEAGIMRCDGTSWRGLVGGNT